MISDDMIQAGAEALAKRNDSVHPEAFEGIAKCVLDAALSVVEPVENGELITTVKEWYDWSREWSGSAFLNDEQDNKMTESECKAELYRGLCSLGNHMLWLEDKLRDIGPPAPSVAVKALTLDALKQYFASLDTGDIGWSDMPTALYTYLLMDGYIPEDGARQAIRSALSAQVQDVAVWQTMDTAPKDGTPVVLWTVWAGDEISPDPFSEVQIGYWDHGNDLPESHEFSRRPEWVVQRIGDPTHWMPLPAAPAKQEN